jgi:hypothetical protein
MPLDLPILGYVKCRIPQKFLLTKSQRISEGVGAQKRYRYQNLYASAEPQKDIVNKISY